MERSENQSCDDFRLSKSEILRGHKVYERILKSSKIFSTDILKAFLEIPGNKEQIDSGSPHFTPDVKVGFVVAKKKIRKSYLRNRIRRLLRESYRLNKICFRNSPGKINLLFSLTDEGYNNFRLDPEIKCEVISKEMVSLSKKISKHLVKI